MRTSKSFSYGGIKCVLRELVCVGYETIANWLSTKWSKSLFDEVIFQSILFMKVIEMAFLRSEIQRENCNSPSLVFLHKKYYFVIIFIPVALILDPNCFPFSTKSTFFMAQLNKPAQRCFFQFFVLQQPWTCKKMAVNGSFKPFLKFFKSFWNLKYSLSW